MHIAVKAYNALNNKQQRRCWTKRQCYQFASFFCRP